MARIRSIKPEFWSSEQVMSCSYHARLFFIGLWTFCDDSGVHPLKPVSLKALIFPGDSIDSTTIRRLLDELSENALVHLYEVEGKEFVQVSGWHHQRIDKPTRKYPTQEQGIPLKTGTYLKEFEESSRSTIGALSEASATELELEIKQDQNQKTCAKSKKQPSAIASGFDVFWKMYPSKKGKAEAVKAWAKIKQFEVPVIMASLGKHIGCRDWIKDDGQFIPMPSTWLNKRRFEDEVKPYVAGTGSNTGASGTSRTSLIDQVNAAGIEQERRRQLSLQPPPIDDRDWPEFANIREVDGSIVGMDD